MTNCFCQHCWCNRQWRWNQNIYSKPALNLLLPSCLIPKSWITRLRSFKRHLTRLQQTFYLFTNCFCEHNWSNSHHWHQLFCRGSAIWVHFSFICRNQTPWLPSDFATLILLCSVHCFRIATARALPKLRSLRRKYNLDTVGATETLGAPRNLERWGSYVGTSFGRGHLVLEQRWPKLRYAR